MAGSNLALSGNAFVLRSVLSPLAARGRVRVVAMATVAAERDPEPDGFTTMTNMMAGT